MYKQHRHRQSIKDIKGRDIIQQLEQQELMSTHSMDAPTSEALVRCCHYLPEELLVEIMSWLPVYSLLRCKSVQKLWHRLINTIIRDKTFVAKHLKNSMDRHSLFISSDRNRPFLDGTEFSIATICNANDDSDHIETVIEDFDLSFYIEQHEISFPGSHCNGIICLCGFGRNNILVFNPALREFKLMTSSCFGPWKRRKQKLLVGLGHDIIDNVYKVIRVVYVNCEFLGAEIHTLGIDHHDMWREINIEVEFCQVCTPRFMNQDVEYKGIVYWLAGGCCSGNPMIVSFDVHDEKFKTIALPAADDELSTNDACLERTYKLAMWNGFVTLFKFYRQICDCIEGSTCPSRKTIEMWVMRDGFCKDPANKSYFWTKHLSISHLEQLYRPLFFWNNDELILKSFARTTDLPFKVTLASYNIRTQKIRSLHGIPEMLDGICSFTYVKSLVLIN